MDSKAEDGLFSFPSKIQLQTINRCNYACPMCPYPTLVAPNGKVQLPTELYHRLLAEVREEGARVKLCLMLQNEPLLDKRFIEMLETAHRAEDSIASVSTVSNGSVLSRELLDQLMAFDRFYLTISVNASDRERYQRIHGKDLWQKIHRLLTGWQGQRDRVRLSFVVDDHSVSEARRFREYWGSLGYAIRFVPIFARVDTLAVEAPMTAVETSYGHCHYPVDTLTVLADGGVIMCCNDWQHEDRFGNLNEMSIKELWNQPDWVAVRRSAIAGTLRRDREMCRSCDYPLRSSTRMQLEARLSTDEPDASDGSFQSHGTHLRPRGGRSRVPLLVYHLDPADGTVYALVERGRGALPRLAELELRIGHRGSFNFGSLESMWCRAEVEAFDQGPQTHDTRTVKIRLDHGDPAFGLLPWYRADWQLAPEAREVPYSA